MDTNPSGMTQAQWDVWNKRSASSYRDNRLPEGTCAHCKGAYRGPEDFCCLTCALKAA